MLIPELKRSGRRREFDRYDDIQKSAVVRGWFFETLSHRQMDIEFLGVSPSKKKGFESMNILHYLGLKKEFQGLFRNHETQQVVAMLSDDTQDFSEVIQLLQPSELLLDDLVRNENYRVKASAKNSSIERMNRIHRAPTIQKRLRVYSYVYDRNPDIIAEALYRAAGVCDHCQSPAPFLRASDGTPFLEVHHDVPLSQGGEDSVQNVVALCPNCHKKAHYGNELEE